MSSKIKVLHVIADLDPRSGGTSRAVADLTSALSRERGLDVAVMFQSRPGQAHLQTDRSVRRIQVTVGSPWARATGWPMRSALLNEVTRSIPDVIHLHGLWLPSCHWTARLAARRNIPLVIQPHGMLEPWALNHKAVRKRVSMAIYQRRDLNVASLLVASTEREAESLRRLGLERDVVVIPHGIRIDNESNSVGDHAQAKKDLREVLFLSRLHPVKGVSTLLRAWSEMERVGWKLIVAGPDEAGYLRKMRDLAVDLGLQNDVHFVGEVHGPAKASAYRSADIFVLPTASENFGIVIAEALAYGVPVITTRAAPWRALETGGCGWWIEQGVAPLGAALRSAMTLSDDQRKAMGEKGRVVARQYDWGVVAAAMASAYRDAVVA